jgi:hypothetical protein
MDIKFQRELVLTQFPGVPGKERRVRKGGTLLTKLTNYGQFSKELVECRSVNSDIQSRGAGSR